MKKNVLFLVCAVLFSVAGAFAQKVVADGTWGNLTWSLTDDGVLTVSGTGDVEDVEEYGAPWSNYRSDIRSVVMGNGVTSIGGGAFEGCNNLTAVNMPGVTTIRSETFWNCSSLATVTMPSVIIVETRAFEESLWYDNLPDGPVYIGKTLYGYKGEMPANTVIDVPEGIVRVLSLSDKNLVAINLPSTLTTFDNFRECSGLKSITIPENVTTILGYRAFEGCTSLQTVNFNAINLINIVPSPLFEFGANESITTLNIGSKVTNIPAQAFLNCYNISNPVTMPSVTNIGTMAFDLCSKIPSVDMPNVITIGEYAFRECAGITSLTIPESVTGIDEGAFSYCSSLDTVKVFWESPLTLEEYTGSFLSSNVFYEIKPSCVLSVPKGTKAAYQSAPVWKAFNQIVERATILEDHITVEINQHSVTITWQPIADAFGYIITVYSDPELTNVICTIRIDANGIFVSIRSSGVGDYSYTIDELLGGTNYYYKLSATDENDQPFDEITGSFITLESSGVEEAAVHNLVVYGKDRSIVVENAENQPIKIVDITGKMVVNKAGDSTIEQFFVPNQGIYLVIVGNKAQKVLVP